MLPMEVDTREIKFIRNFKNTDMWQGTHSKTVYEVIDTPSDNNIIIYSNKQRHNAWRNADTAEPRMNCSPHS